LECQTDHCKCQLVKFTKHHPHVRERDRAHGDSDCGAGCVFVYERRASSYLQGHDVLNVTYVSFNCVADLFLAILTPDAKPYAIVQTIRPAKVVAAVQQKPIIPANKLERTRRLNLP
jgi:hypothetical protein